MVLCSVCRGLARITMRGAAGVASQGRGGEELTSSSISNRVKPPYLGDGGAADVTAEVGAGFGEGVERGGI